MSETKDGLTPEERAEIDALSRIEMARLWRFAPAGHRYFVSGTPLNEYFKRRFEGLGGFSPEISKQIGW